MLVLRHLPLVLFCYDEQPHWDTMNILHFVVVCRRPFFLQRPPNLVHLVMRLTTLLVTSTGSLPHTAMCVTSIYYNSTHEGHVPPSRHQNNCVFSRRLVGLPYPCFFSFSFGWKAPLSFSFSHTLPTLLFVDFYSWHWL